MERAKLLKTISTHRQHKPTCTLKGPEKEFFPWIKLEEIQTTEKGDMIPGKVGELTHPWLEIQLNQRTIPRKASTLKGVSVSV